jgi:hypothetical protein
MAIFRQLRAGLDTSSIARKTAAPRGAPTRRLKTSRKDTTTCFYPGCMWQSSLPRGGNLSKSDENSCSLVYPVGIELFWISALNECNGDL